MRGRAGELVALRTSLGISQADLARRLGVDQATISRWERGLQVPDRRARVKLAELTFRLDVARGMRSEVALVEHSPFPMAIIASDWTVIALSDSVLLRAPEELRREGGPRQKKETTADMEQAVSILRKHRFFEGKIAAARIVARGYVLWRDLRLFEAVCTPVNVEGEICRLMQYQYLSEKVFAKRRERFGLVTLLDSRPRGAAQESVGDGSGDRPRRDRAGA
jgi:transcriptional regulator with XRE-family HTH domain